MLDQRIPQVFTLIRHFSISPKKQKPINKERKPKTCDTQCLMTSFFVIPLRFERKTHALEGRCSIQLSYGTSLNCGAKVRFFIETTNKRQ